jgi:hypothetical protein
MNAVVPEIESVHPAEVSVKGRQVDYADLCGTSEVDRVLAVQILESNILKRANPHVHVDCYLAPSELVEQRL